MTPCKGLFWQWRGSRFAVNCPVTGRESPIPPLKKATTSGSGITAVSMKADGSRHYRCHLDRDKRP